MPMARPGTSKAFIPLWMEASRAGISADMRASIGVAELDWLCAQVTVDTCEHSRTVVRAAAEPARATIDAIMIDNAPCAKRSVGTFMPIPHYGRLT